MKIMMREKLSYDHSAEAPTIMGIGHYREGNLGDS